MKRLLATVGLILVLNPPGLAAPEAIELKGQWNFALDPKDLGFKQPRENWRFPDTITLPGVVTA
ncbi:MAG: hypothetical protein ACKO2G_04850 [Verrucomicrobiales bacterium]